MAPAHDSNRFKFSALGRRSVTWKQRKGRPERLKTNKVKHRSAGKVYAFSNQPEARI